jgi:hypothetical protein
MPRRGRSRRPSRLGLAPRAPSRKTIPTRGRPGRILRDPQTKQRVDRTHPRKLRYDDTLSRSTCAHVVSNVGSLWFIERGLGAECWYIHVRPLQLRVNPRHPRAQTFRVSKFSRAHVLVRRGYHSLVTVLPFIRAGLRFRQMNPAKGQATAASRVPARCSRGSRSERRTHNSDCNPAGASILGLDESAGRLPLRRRRQRICSAAVVLSLRRPLL